MKVKELVTQLCPALSLWPHGLYVICQAPLSRRFSRQEYWSGQPFQGILLTQGLDPGLLHCRHFLYCLSHREALSFCPQDSTSLSNYLSPFTFWKTISKPLKQLIPFHWKSFNYKCAYSPRDYICIYIYIYIYLSYTINWQEIPLGLLMAVSTNSTLCSRRVGACCLELLCGFLWEGRLP